MAEVFKERSRNYFNEHRKSWLAHGGYWKHDYKFTLREIGKFMPERLVDIGCGPGAFLTRVQEEYPQIQLNALDISEEMIKETRSRLAENADKACEEVRSIRGDSREDAEASTVLKDAIMTAGDAENMPFEDGEFQAVTCNMSIHHYPHPQKAVNEMFRILAPEGVLLLNDMDCAMPIRSVANIAFPHMKGGDVKMYNRAEILHMLKAAGFKKFKYRKISPFSFLCVAVK